MNHGMGRGAGRGSEHQQMSRGMNDVFVTDNGFRPSGPRFDEFGPGGVPPDRSGFGLRYCHSDSLETFFHPLIHMRDQDKISPYNINAISSRQVMRVKKKIN